MLVCLIVMCQSVKFYLSQYFYYCNAQVLLSWLESLPKSDTESLEHGPPSPGPGSHNNSIDSNINTINRRNQTLTRTNPYRHKVSVYREN